MINGVFCTLGVIIIILSRIFYAIYDYGSNNSVDRDFLTGAIIADIIGTAIVVCSILENYGITGS